jgi:hypothetical protein
MLEAIFNLSTFEQRAICLTPVQKPLNLVRASSSSQKTASADTVPSVGGRSTFMSASSGRLIHCTCSDAIMKIIFRHLLSRIQE